MLATQLARCRSCILLCVKWPHIKRLAVQVQRSLCSQSRALGIEHSVLADTGQLVDTFNSIINIVLHRSLRYMPCSVL